MPTPALSLVLGGARSGKSRLAERLAMESGLTRIYLATAQAWDTEMAARIAQHREDRGPEWRTIEAPIEAPAAIVAEAGPGRVLLLDCLTLWLSNVMLAERDIEAHRRALRRSEASGGAGDLREQRGRPQHRAGQRLGAPVSRRARPIESTGCCVC